MSFIMCMTPKFNVNMREIDFVFLSVLGGRGRGGFGRAERGERGAARGGFSRNVLNMDIQCSDEEEECGDDEVAVSRFTDGGRG